MTVVCLSGKESVRMINKTRLPSQAALDRMQREAEIKSLRGQTFKTYCEGLQTITPLIRWVVCGVIAIFTMFI